LSLSGQVLDTRGDVLPDATIEIWQADHSGYYDIDGYRYRGKLLVDASGQYRFETVMPGHYPDRSRVCQPFNTADAAQADAAADATVDRIYEDLAALKPPRKHYQRYYATREANDNSNQ